MSNECVDFFKRIKDWVDKKDISLKNFIVLDLGFKLDTYNTWQKKAKTNPNMDLPSATFVYAVAKKMGVSMEWLITGTESNLPPGDEYLQRILRVYEILDERDRQSLAGIAEMFRNNISLAKQKTG